MKNLLFIYFTILLNFCFAQKKQANSKSFECNEILNAADIDNALVVKDVEKIILKCSPKGKGKYNEVGSGKSRDKNYFKEEHNIVWIKFTASSDGNLIFRIKPRKATDDYDFLLFKIEDNTSISKIKNKTLKPIRTNISRTDTEEKGLTGLNTSATATHIVSGVHNNYSKFINVKKGEAYYLVLDNVYSEGEGAIVHLKYQKTIDISGVIKNENKPLDAEINWTDAKTGKILSTTKTNPANGEFSFSVPFDNIQPEKKYILSVTSDEHFFKETTYTTTQIAKQTTPISVLLPQLKKGKKFPIHNINFVGNSPRVLPSGKPSLNNLLKLMQKNKSLHILIEGHTNGCSGGMQFVQKLSEDRAKAVLDYLCKNGIEFIRVETIGYNCSQMLYPTPRNEKESSLNRRVEILVTEF